MLTPLPSMLGWGGGRAWDGAKECMSGSHRHSYKESTQLWLCGQSGKRATAEEDRSCRFSPHAPGGGSHQARYRYLRSNLQQPWRNGRTTGILSLAFLISFRGVCSGEPLLSCGLRGRRGWGAGGSRRRRDDNSAPRQRLLGTCRAAAERSGDQPPEGRDAVDGLATKRRTPVCCGWIMAAGALFASGEGDAAVPSGGGVTGTRGAGCATACPIAV